MMRIIKTCLKVFIAIMMVFIVCYFSMFRSLNRKSVKSVFNVLLSNNTLDSNTTHLDKNNELDIQGSLVTMTISSKKISKLNIELYNNNNNLINTIGYSDCILKQGNTCTYLIKDYNVAKIKIDKYDINNIKINNNRKIIQVKKHIFRHFIISCLIVAFIYCIIKFGNKYSIDDKIQNKFCRFNINKSFVLTATIIGIVTSILIPLYQVPDEQTHINMIYQERNISTQFQDSLSNTTGAEGILTHPSRKVNVQKYFSFHNTINTDNIINIPDLSLIRHFPQSIGMLLGEILHLPVFFYITLCELFALAFYIFICNIALKKIPIKKNLMMLIMLLPVAIQQMASFSYDVVLNSFCFLFIAYVLELKLNKGFITNKDIVKLMLILFVIAICKIPYILIALILFVLPIKNIIISIGNRKITYEKMKQRLSRYKIISAVSIFIIFAFMMFVCLNLLFKIDIGRVLITSILNFQDTMILYTKTFKTFYSYYFDTISGNLGWFDTKFPILFQMYVYVSLIVVTFIKSNQENRIDNVLTRKDRIVFWITACLFVYIIVLSMFEWTLMCSKVDNYNKLSIMEYANYIKIIPYIGGVQGRYFIPVLPLILIPLHSKRISNLINKLNPLFYQIVYYLVLFIIISIVLLYRYWI